MKNDTPQRYFDALRTQDWQALDAELAEFVARHRAEPFFLYFAPLSVHAPVQVAPAKYLRRVPPEITE